MLVQSATDMCLFTYQNYFLVKMHLVRGEFCSGVGGTFGKKYNLNLKTVRTDALQYTTS